MDPGAPKAKPEENRWSVHFTPILDPLGCSTLARLQADSTFHSHDCLLQDPSPNCLLLPATPPSALVIAPSHVPGVGNKVSRRGGKGVTLTSGTCRGRRTHTNDQRSSTTPNRCRRGAQTRLSLDPRPSLLAWAVSVELPLVPPTRSSPARVSAHAWGASEWGRTFDRARPMVPITCSKNRDSDTGS